MTLIRVFLERPRMLILSLIFFLLVGYSGFNNLPRQETPELAERWGLLIQVYPGTSPEQIETQVTEVLEIKLREIPIVTAIAIDAQQFLILCICLLYTSPSPRDLVISRMPSSA